MNTLSKCTIIGLLFVICILGGIIAFHTRPRPTPKDWSTLKRDLLELQAAAGVSANAAAFTVVAFDEPVRWGQAIQKLHNDLAIQPLPPGAASNQMVEVFAAAQLLHYGATHSRGPQHLEFPEIKKLYSNLHSNCLVTFTALTLQEQEP